MALLLASCVALGLDVGGSPVERGRVLYLAGENPDDVRMRWIALAYASGFQIHNVDVYFNAGAFKLGEEMNVAKKEIEKLGEVSLIIVDTSAAFFGGDEENDNVQMGNYARTLRMLTELPGRPVVLAATHPVKNVLSDNLVPRGGGAFLNEVDGNLTCRMVDRVVEVHWTDKFRGPNFEPFGFELLNTTAPTLKDSKGRNVFTVVAKALSSARREEIETEAQNNLERVLVLLSVKPGLSISEMARELKWVQGKENNPAKSKVERLLRKLAQGKLAKKKGIDG